MSLFKLSLAISFYRHVHIYVEVNRVIRKIVMLAAKVTYKSVFITHSSIGCAKEHMMQMQIAFSSANVAASMFLKYAFYHGMPSPLIALASLFNSGL